MSRDRKILVGVVIVAFLAAVALVVFGAKASASPWLQQTGRDSAEAPCPEGWGPSWAEWPNDHTGGWVCTREVEDPSCSYTPCAAAPVSTPAPTLPPWPSGREFLYSGGRIVNGVLGGGSGYTYVSSPFNICTTWSAARVTSLNNLVTVDSWVNNGYVYVYNPGNQTTISIYVTCA